MLLMGDSERDRQEDSESEIVMHRQREEMMREIETAEPERSLCHSHSSELCNNATIGEGEIRS